MKNFFITTSLPYVNAAPHVGFAMEAIEADALARFQKQRGREVRLQTGTDEHGLKIQNSAAQNSTTPAKLTAENSAKFRELKSALDFDFDDFIRTSDRDRHFPAAQKMWSRIAAAGKLEKRKYAAKYCAGCEEFKNEKDLISGKCPNHPGAELESIEEENYFFRLSDFSAEILELLESKKVEILPHFRATEFLNVVRDGLHDVSFSRSSAKLKWGVPVPGDDSQTMYVWCDALTNYISALGFADDDSAEFEKWWKNSEKVHVIGKDIVRFHAGIWLGMLLAAKLPLPDKIYIHGFITAEGEKMSKSRGNVVDPFEFSEKWGSDSLRFYLLAEIPNGQDGDFSAARFVEIYNSALANGLGNLVSRVVAMAEKISPEFKFENSAEIPEVAKMWSAVENSVNSEFDFRGALAAIFALVEFANKFVSERKIWELSGDEKNRRTRDAARNDPANCARARPVFAKNCRENCRGARRRARRRFRKIEKVGRGRGIQIDSPRNFISEKMKGVVLAGGKGSRLLPLTKITNKHLLPVHDRPMIFFPLATLRDSGISEILVVTDPQFLPEFKKVVAKFPGVRISFATQKKPDGIAGALRLAEKFAAGENLAVILGDNIFESNFRAEVRAFESGAEVFLKKVADPERFGVAEISGRKVVRIVEKPKRPKSDLAVVGLYFFDKKVFDIIRKIQPSKRGELEITDVNNFYISQKTLIFSKIKGLWRDAGTLESLAATTKFIREKVE